MDSRPVQPPVTRRRIARRPSATSDSRRHCHAADLRRRTSGPRLRAGRPRDAGRCSSTTCSAAGGRRTWTCTSCCGGGEGPERRRGGADRQRPGGGGRRREGGLPCPHLPTGRPENRPEGSVPWPPKEVKTQGVGVRATRNPRSGRLLSVYALEVGERHQERPRHFRLLHLSLLQSSTHSVTFPCTSCRPNGFAENEPTGAVCLLPHRLPHL